MTGTTVQLVFDAIVIVGVGHPEYRFLRHATGSRPPEADR